MTREEKRKEVCDSIFKRGMCNYCMVDSPYCKIGQTDRRVEDRRKGDRRKTLILEN